MHPIAEQLLQRHVAFELDALTGQALQPVLRSEVQRWFELADDLTLKEYATPQRCVAAFKRLLVKANIPESAGQLGVSLFLILLQNLEESNVDVQAVIGRERFLELVDIAASLHEPRRRLVAELFNHPLYSELISSLVYLALVNYLIEDNVFSQRVPGVGSMLKLGRKVANRAVPGLDATVERQLKSYIKGYLPSLIKASEQFVESAVTDEGLQDNVAEAWPDIGSRQLAGLVEGLTPEDAERLGDWSRRSWDEIRRSEPFISIGESLIAHLFDRYGNEPLSLLLTDVGIARSMVSKELLAFAPPLLKRLRKTGYLEDLLRSRLMPFYESEAVKEVLESSSSR
jgi:hypothetical protein